MDVGKVMMKLISSGTTKVVTSIVAKVVRVFVRDACKEKLKKSAK
jgi:hypothetical protein